MRLRDAFDRGIDIGIGIDDDGILTTHFEKVRLIQSWPGVESRRSC